MQSPNLFQTKFGFHHGRKSLDGIEKCLDRVAAQTDSRSHVVFPELAISVKFQQERCHNELVEDCWIQQSNHKRATLFEQREEASLEIADSRLEVQCPICGVGGVERFVAFLKQAPDPARAQDCEARMILKTPSPGFGLGYSDHLGRQVHSYDAESLLSKEECFDPCVAPDVKEQASGGCQVLNGLNR